MNRTLLLTCLITLIFCSQSRGAVITLPDDHSLIQDAINAAVDGDTILVRAGIWTENIDFFGKAITLQSCHGPEMTAIDRRAAGSVVSFVSGEGSGSIIEGFTLANGKAPNGAGILCSGGSSPVIRGNVITSNWASGSSADGYGGGINCDESSPLISGNTIMLNTAAYAGGGICCRNQAEASIVDNVIVQNTGSGYGGGGIYCRDCSPDILNNRIEGNNAYSKGGGISCVYSSSLIRDNMIEGNSAQNSGGAGIYCFESPVTIVSNTIKGNDTVGDGGGIYSFESSATISNNVIFWNEAGRGGGGIWFRDESNPMVVNCTITRNSASEGGGIHAYAEADPIVVNTILWGNAAPQGKELFVDGMWTYQASLTISFSDVEGGLNSTYVGQNSTLNWGQGMIDADPLFAGSGIADFHLLPASPCRNSGDSTVAGLPAEDFEGDPRIHDGTVDMGADENHPHLYHVGDVVPGALISLRVIGPPGETVTLGLGTGVLDPPLPTSYGDFYLQGPVQSFPLGSIGTDGILAVASAVPAAWLVGEEHPVQALIGPIGNPASFLTNHEVLTVNSP